MAGPSLPQPAAGSGPELEMREIAYGLPAQGRDQRKPPQRGFPTSGAEDANGYRISPPRRSVISAVSSARMELSSRRHVTIPHNVAYRTLDGGYDEWSHLSDWINCSNYVYPVVSWASLKWVDR
jgi:hypothetical protein